MSGAQALIQLQKKGYSIAIKNGKLAYRYTGTGTPETSEVIPLIRALKEDAETAIQALSAGIFGRKPDEPDIMDMPLDQFAKSSIAIKIFSVVLGQQIWLVPDRPQGPWDKASYEAIELKNLIQLEPTVEEMRLIQWIKEDFRGAKIQRVDLGLGKELNKEGRSDPEKLQRRTLG
jgi:hypothetical protein